MIDLDIHEGAGCAVTFHVQVKPAACESARKQAIRETRKKVSIPGFRKGKVPESVIESKFAESVQDRTESILRQEVFNQCVTQSGIWPWNNETIECSHESELELTYRFERTPQVPEIGEINLPEIPLEEVTDEAIAELAAKAERPEEECRKHLEGQAKQQQQQAQIEALWKYLFETYSFDLPASLEGDAKAFHTLFLSRAICDRAGLQLSHADVVTRTRDMLTWQALMEGKKPPPLDESTMRPYYDRVRLQLIKELAEDHLLSP